MEGEKMRSPQSQLSNDQWMDIIQYLGAEDFKALRLAGNKNSCLSDPCLTSNLRLRMDRVPFFCENNLDFPEPYVRRWLANRCRLVINDADAKLSLNRVRYLAANGFLNSVSEIIVHDCHHHQMILETLSNLPNMKTLSLIDQGDQSDALSQLEAIIFHVGNMRSLQSLDIDLNTVIHGSRLSFLKNLEDMKHLRLVGFDLSDGINYISGLKSLQTLHLCHGNFYSSPSNDANEKDLMALASLTNIQRVHLEGFDCLAGVGLSSFSTTGSTRHLALKHCQELSEDCLMYVGQMAALESLHFVNSSCDDVDFFERDSLQHMSTLQSLKSLSLFYMLADTTDLLALPRLVALETLNIAMEDELSIEDVENLCREVQHIFPSLRRLRIFSEDNDNSMDCSFHCPPVDVEFQEFTFGDLVYLD